MTNYAVKGTVCPPCWLDWDSPRSHKSCLDRWQDEDKTSGWTICLCGCVRSKVGSKRARQ